MKIICQTLCVKNGIWRSFIFWIAAISLNGSISLTLADSADIKVTAFSTAYRTFHTFQAANHRRLYKRNARSRKEACGTSERRGKQTAETGEETRAMIEGDQREDINRPSPSLTFWQALSKLNFRIWKKGSAVCLRIPPAGSFVIYVRDVRPAGAIVDIQ